ncbi:LLM class flavin-dependent oxidoreductase [Niabella terrae]
MAIPVSALDLALVPEGGNYKTAIDRAVAIAQFLEATGYRRIWLAEHHNMPHIASSATTLLIGHIAQQTRSIRVGSGGIMLPNHSTLSVAEHFGTLEAMFPGRIDLGLGRAPGTDNRTALALRGENYRFDYDFEGHILQLRSYLENDSNITPVRAFPGEGADIPFYILGSSTDSAHLAAKLGLPYAFAAHFAPRMLEEAAAIYRAEFQASSYLSQPYFMVCVNTIIAATDEQAQYLSTSLYQTFIGVLTNNRKALQPPVESMEGLWNEEIRYHLNNMLSASFIGSPTTVAPALKGFIDRLQIDEIIASAALYDMEDRKNAYRMLKEILDQY